MTVGRLIIAAALMLTAFLPSPRAETLLGSTVSEEVFLYMKVNPEAAQALLPEGWTLAPWTKGAWAGANLLIIRTFRGIVPMVAKGANITAGIVSGMPGHRYCRRNAWI